MTMFYIIICFNVFLFDPSLYVPVYLPLLTHHATTPDNVLSYPIKYCISGQPDVAVLLDPLRPDN